MTVLRRTPHLVHRNARRGAALTMALGLGALTACSGGSEAPAESAATSISEEAPALPTQSSASSPVESSAASSPAESSAASSPATLRATEVDFAIELPQRELEAGDYTIEVVNEGQASHDLVVEDASGNDIAASDILAPGESGTVEVSLEPGEYVFYCSVGNHRGMGMEVSVTVA